MTAVLHCPAEVRVQGLHQPDCQRGVEAAGACPAIDARRSGPVLQPERIMPLCLGQSGLQYIHSCYGWQLPGIIQSILRACTGHQSCTLGSFWTAAGSGRI